MNSEPASKSTVPDSIMGTAAALGSRAAYETWNHQVQISINQNGLVYIPFTSTITHFKGQRSINPAFLLKLTHTLIDDIAHDIDSSWIWPITIIGKSPLADERLRQIGRQDKKEIVNWGIDGLLEETLICADGQHRHLAGMKANKKGWYAHIISRGMYFINILISSTNIDYNYRSMAIWHGAQFCCPLVSSCKWYRKSSTSLFTWRQTSLSIMSCIFFTQSSFSRFLQG